MALRLEKLTEELPFWIQAIGRFSESLREILGDSLVAVYASESPWLGYGDYNVVVVVREMPDEG